MTETDYFGRLEMRVCRELAGMHQTELQWMWCDGFIPEEFAVVGQRCRMTGRVWVAWGGRRQECWTFALLLGGETLDRDCVDWAAMLPAGEFTGWLSLDFDNKSTTICPSAQYADPKPVT